MSPMAIFRIDHDDVVWKFATLKGEIKNKWSMEELARTHKTYTLEASLLHKSADKPLPV